MWNPRSVLAVAACVLIAQPTLSAQGLRNLNTVKHLLERDLWIRRVPKREPPATLEAVRTRLASKDLPTVAWGAYLAAGNDLKDAAPDVCKAMVRLAARDSREIQFVGMALLDSLIRLGADVPQEALRPWTEQPLLAPTIVLAARNPKRHEKLLVDIMARQEGGSWWVTGNLLVSTRSKKVVRQLLKQLFVEVLIQLRETNNDWSKMTGMDSCCGFSLPPPTSFRVPMSYPPTAHYSLCSGKFHGSTEFLAPGGTAVYYRRRLHASCRYRVSPPEPLDALPYIQTKLRWIAELLNTKVEALPFRRCVKINMVWRDAETYVRKMNIEKAKARGAFRSLMNRLACAGLCDKNAVANLSPQLLIKVQDNRSKKLPVLPKLEGVKVYRWPHDD